MGSEFNTLSKELANAARLAWQGVRHLDAPAEDGRTLADNLAESVTEELDTDVYNVNRRSRPDLWQRAALALDANLPAPRDAHLGEAVCLAIGNAFRGVVLLEDIELLEDLPLPKTMTDASRRQVTDALNILRGLIEQQGAAADVIPDEMQTSHERAYAAQRETARKVHTALNILPTDQRDILVSKFGIKLPSSAAPSFDDDAELVVFLGIPFERVDGLLGDALTGFAHAFETGEPLVPVIDGPTKTCTKCNVTRPTSEFYADKGKPDGLTQRLQAVQEGRSQEVPRDQPGRALCAVSARRTPRRPAVRSLRLVRRVREMNPKSQRAWDAFRARVEELGGVVVEPEWLGYNKPHLVICGAGHINSPHPSSVLNGVGVCEACGSRAAGNRASKSSEDAFRERVEEWGGEVIGTYAGSDKPVHVRCAAGHDCNPYPGHVRKGIGICRTCAGNYPHVAEAHFRARLAELGAAPLFDKWQGVNTPHLVKCPRGHECTPRSSHTKKGIGICRRCKGMHWDAFYVTLDPDTDTIKFGITSGDPRPRLSNHARDGFTEVLLLRTNMPGDDAPRLERRIISALAEAGMKPVRGNEYFPRSALGLVMDLAA